MTANPRGPKGFASGALKMTGGLQILHSATMMDLKDLQTFPSKKTAEDFKVNEHISLLAIFGSQSKHVCPFWDRNLIFGIGTLYVVYF